MVTQISRTDPKISRRDLNPTKLVWRPFCTAAGGNRMQKSEFAEASAVLTLYGHLAHPGGGDCVQRGTHSTKGSQHPP